MATPEEIRRAREVTAFGGIFNNLFAANRRTANQLAQEGRRPVLGGLLSKEPVMGIDTLRYEGIGPLIGGMLEPIIRGADAPRAASQNLIPQEDMTGEAFGTAGAAMIGAGLAAKPSGALGANTLRVYHGGPKRLSSSEVEMRSDPEGTPIGFSVTDNPDVAEYYRKMRGGGSISEFDIDLDKANIISESELYRFIDDLENKLDADASYEQIQRGLLDAGIDAIEYPDPEFGIRVVNPNILGANASKSAGLLSVASDVADRGDQILSMLKSGRGSEVTDAMLDMGEGVKNTQLNQYLAENYDLPLDEASRLARAREMGFTTGRNRRDPLAELRREENPQLVHYTNKDFQEFRIPERENRKAIWATPDPSLNLATKENFKSFEEEGVVGLPIAARMTERMSPFEFRMQGEPLSEGFPRVVSSEDVAKANRVGANYAETGMEYAIFDPSNIRSQFARFDPRLAHLSNVTAANASKPVGFLVLEQQARGNNRLGGLLESQGMDISDLSTASPAKIQSALDTAVKRGILDPRSAAGLKRGILDGL